MISLEPDSEGEMSDGKEAIKFQDNVNDLCFKLSIYLHPSLSPFP